MDYNQYYLNIIHRLKIRCFQKFGSQRELAVKLGLDPGNLSKILTGVTKPTAILFIRICDELDYHLSLTLNPFDYGKKD